VQSLRLSSDHEALVARALTKEGKVGFGFSMGLDATEARHMAEWHAGARAQRPLLEPRLGHAWEQAYVENKPVPWDAEPGFAALAWLSS
jgi:hypothetical protein